jgi:hypothetical protein
VADAWGGSWGSSWGVSWGEGAEPPRTQSDPGAGFSRSSKTKKPKLRPGRRVRVLIYAEDKLTAATEAPQAAVATPIPRSVIAKAIAAVAPDYGAFTAKVAERLPRKVYSAPAMQPNRVDLAASLAAFMRIEMQRLAAETKAADDANDEEDIELLLMFAA